MRGIGALGRGAGLAGMRGGTRAGGARGFAVAGGAEASAPATTAAGIDAVGASLLILQAENATAERDAAARQRAESLLEELRRLQLGLLGGETDRDSLHRLAALRLGEEGADPALREVVEAIALRAAIELARRGEV